MAQWYWGLLTGLWMAGIWYLSDQPDLSTGLATDFLWRKLAHVTEYGVLVFLLAHTLSVQWRKLPVLFTAAGIAMAYAGLDEWHQSWVAGRHGTWRDVVIDAVGVLLTLTISGYGRRDL